VRNVLLRGEPDKFWSAMVRIINENTWSTLSILCVKVIRSLVLGVKKKPRPLPYTRATTANESSKLKFWTDRQELELGR
jgi:hypothetical protein